MDNFEGGVINLSIEEKMKQVGVIGGGIMGSGIAQVFAQSGFEVVLIESSSLLCDKAKARIEKSLDRGIEKKSLKKSDKNKILSQILFTTDLKIFKKPILVVEAVPEVLKIKKEVFKRLDSLLPAKTILASNTSSIPIAQLATATKRPTKVIGMHFMNPVPVMPLIEIVVSAKTSKPTLKTIQQLSQQLGKTAVVAKDAPGFISNRILLPMLNEAVFCYQEKIGTKEDIDKVMKLGMHHPMGPLELADFIGLDTLLEIQEILYKGFKDRKYRPAPLLKKMVQAGKLGKKSGEGFYRYNKSRKK